MQLICRESAASDQQAIISIFLWIFLLCFDAVPSAAKVEHQLQSALTLHVSQGYQIGYLLYGYLMLLS